MQQRVFSEMEIEKNQASNNAEPLGEAFWNNQYINHTTGWDLGQVSPPIKAYLDQLTNKNLRILMPGCGNSYEAEYLLQQGFTNITLIDIAPTLVTKLKNKFAANNNIKIILGDFFNHNGEYDLILEQTFFCALHLTLRKAYVATMKKLVAPNGKLVGVLFDKNFEQNGPPFGGNKTEYLLLFESAFKIVTFESCYNSFYKRQGTELFIILQKIV